MHNLQEVLDALERGGVVACPTETWVALLADATNPAAVERVAELKGRPEGAPMAVLLPSIDAVEQVARPLSVEARALAKAHWPGPLTIVSTAKPGLNAWLTQEGKVGMRVPGPSPALEIVVAFGRPLTATSANLSGESPVASVERLAPKLRTTIDVLVHGVAPGGLASTVVDVTDSPFSIVRIGAVALDALP